MKEDLTEQPASLPTVKDHLASPEHLEMSSGQAGAFPTAGPNPVVAAEPAVLPLKKYHRSEVKKIREIEHVKSTLYETLGTIPVFFFLNELFSAEHYPGPYCNVEKGLVVLYQLVQGYSINEMERFMPRSSFHDIHKAFYVKGGNVLDKKISSMLLTMFSTDKLRVASASLNNPENFKHITLMVDGHDSRALHNGGNKAALYSYKLKKSGYRTQLCIDTNGMILLLSPTVECRDNTNIAMFKMNMLDKISATDCIVLDGGYPMSVLETIVEKSEIYNLSNFCIPSESPEDQTCQQWSKNTTRGWEASDPWWRILLEN
ncbi:hypothetical protein BX667DRAFT_523863 [Coemansia mojavensis]|nr:hypothetical protein BX667DRAFT_523863 [Coemansia mojavensis]